MLHVPGRLGQVLLETEQANAFLLEELSVPVHIGHGYLHPVFRFVSSTLSPAVARSCIEKIDRPELTREGRAVITVWARLGRSGESSHAPGVTLRPIDVGGAASQARPPSGKEGSQKMRRVLIGFTLSLWLLAVPLTPVGAASRSGDPADGRARLADVDGDRVDDVLERRLAKADRGSRQAVVVATDGSVSIAGAHRAAGSFPVSRRLGIIGGFAGRLTAGQIRRLASTPGVVRIDHDAVVRVTMDAARSDYGVDAAREAFGLTGAGVNVCILDTGVDPGARATRFEVDRVVGLHLRPDDALRRSRAREPTWHRSPSATGPAVPRPARFGGAARRRIVGRQGVGRSGLGRRERVVAGVEWCASDPDVDVI